MKGSLFPTIRRVIIKKVIFQPYAYVTMKEALMKAPYGKQLLANGCLIQPVDATLFWQVLFPNVGR